MEIYFYRVLVEKSKVSLKFEIFPFSYFALFSE